jgi:ATP adenylyltransferase
VSNNRSCCLCSQAQGEPANDLIASLLPDQPYVRRVLLESSSFFSVPSLGPIVPGHSLLCPKAHIRSFAALDHDLDQEFTVLKEELREALGRLYDVPVHLFEHGMAVAGTRTLCTVEHAHIHFLPLAGPAPEPELDGRWEDFSGSPQELRTLAAAGEYVLYETPGRRTRILRQVAGIESQYMRKLFAQRVGRPDEWDWRVTPKAALADQAWHRFADFRHDNLATTISGNRPATGA